MDHGLLIGEVAGRSGVSRKALRLYEARGILPPARRTPSGYRCYPADVPALLTFAGQVRRLGLTLDEIRYLVALRRSGAPPCVHVRALLEQKAANQNIVVLKESEWNALVDAIESGQLVRM